MRIGLYITAEPANGKPVTLARVRDQSLLLDAAAVALDEADEMADEMAAQDELLGTLQRQEAGRLRSALELVLPGLRDLRESAAPVM
jgi:hypothetical protein